MDTEKWVHQLNALSGLIDDAARSMHPFAWPEALKGDIEKWKRLAASGPTDSDDVNPPP